MVNKPLKSALLLLLISISAYLFYHHSHESIIITSEISEILISKRLNTHEPTNTQAEAAQNFSSVSPVAVQESSYERTTATQEGVISATNNTRTVVLLISDYRSGSSILGEVFNQNQDVFYLFEPLIGYPLTKTRIFLEKLLLCNPPRWGFVHRNRQNGCPSGVSDKACLNSVNQEVQCRKHTIIAAKFIRIRSIKEIISFGLLDIPNVFVVHSMRDPRGTINSRLMYQTVHYNGISVLRNNITVKVIEEMSDSLCRRYLNDLVSGEGIPEIYVRVTYEELCVDPEASIKKVYGLIGHTPPERVFQWFENHTVGGSDTSDKDKMGLKRDSQLTAIRWKTELPQEFICAVERKCWRVIDYLNLQFECFQNHIFS